MRTFLIALIASTLAAGEGAALDSWYVGDLNGQPAVSLHVVSTPVDGGGRSTAADMTVVLRRSLGKNKDVFRIEVRSRQELVEDGQGRITSFRFDQDENGVRTAAVGKVAEGKISSEIHRLGRIDKQEQAIPAGAEILGMVAQQERLARAIAEAKDAPSPVVFAGLELVSNRVALVTSTARFAGPEADGGLAFQVVTDLLPVPSRIVVDRHGDLLRMGMDLGLFKLEVKRAPGAVALLGADVDSSALVKATGQAPSGRAVERYRLPGGSQAVVDEFQSVEGSVVTVRSEAMPSALEDPKPFLQAESQLEIDDPALRAWALDIARGHGDPLDRADALRLAVRSHITKRDLETADGSALQTFRNRCGDCTEHANLLAAALRIIGIPSRVETGLVYSVQHGGWVGHAWNSGYIAGRWVHLDAAFPGVARSCYLKIGSVSGAEPTKATGAMLAALTGLMGKEIEGLPPAP